MNLLPTGLFLAQAPAASPLPEIRDIVPPMEVFPYPLWMVLVALVLALAALAALGWAVWSWVQKRPAAPPPTPREVALRELEEVSQEVETADPHFLAERISDILRIYISRHYGLRATRQTSPEFLASVADSPRFSEADRGLLANFLEQADLLKFARVEAGPAESVMLLEEGVRFVKGSA